MKRLKSSHIHAIMLAFLLSSCGGSGTEVELDSLSISVGSLEQIFQSNQASYTASVGFLASSIKVKATTVDTGATIKVNNVDVDANNLSQSIILSEGANTEIVIKVTKNTATKIYTLTITRQSLTSLAEQAELHASDAQENDQFGYSVSLSGETLAVGAYAEDGGAGAPALSAGAVYIYTRSGSTWTEQQILRASDLQAGDYFGNSVSLSGETLAVGAVFENGGTGDPALSAGAVYIYTRSGSTWTEQQILRSSDVQAYDYFGSSVSLSGESLAIGANGEDRSAGDLALSAGAVYIYTRSGSTWTEQQILRASDAQVGDWFGSSVSLSGETLAVGANGEDGGTGDPVSDAGAVYIYTRNGSIWTEEQILQASNAQANDWFGYSVSLYGETIAIGAAYSVRGGASAAGAVYIYTHNGSTWTEQQILHASDAQANDLFGYNVSLSGETLAVGALGEDAGVGDPIVEAGAAYIYTRSGSTWTEQQILRASDLQASDYFGYSVSLSGESLAVGAYAEDGGTGDSIFDAGAAYVYQ